MFVNYTAPAGYGSVFYVVVELVCDENENLKSLMKACSYFPFG